MREPSKRREKVPRPDVSRATRTTLSLQIRTLREQRNWTQSDLAEWCGVQNPQISKMENGDLGDPVLRLLMIAELFECELQFVPISKQDTSVKPRE